MIHEIDIPVVSKTNEVFKIVKGVPIGTPINAELKETIRDVDEQITGGALYKKGNNCSTLQIGGEIEAGNCYEFKGWSHKGSYFFLMCYDNRETKFNYLLNALLNCKFPVLVTGKCDCFL